MTTLPSLSSEEAALFRDIAAATESMETAELTRLQVQQAVIGIESARLALESSQLAYARSVRSEREDAAKDELNRRYVLTGSVDSGTATKALATFAQWHRATPGCPIEVTICSPGGSVFDGLAIYDYLRMLSRWGHQITTVALGYAASMGGIILQAGDHRILGAESYLLLHEPSTGAIGKVGEMEDRTEMLKLLCRRQIALFAARSTLTAEEIEKNWRRTDWWLDSAEALAARLVDEVV